MWRPRRGGPRRAPHTARRRPYIRNRLLSRARRASRDPSRQKRAVRPRTRSRLPGNAPTRYPRVGTCARAHSPAPDLAGSARRALLRSKRQRRETGPPPPQAPRVDTTSPPRSHPRPAVLVSPNSPRVAVGPYDISAVVLERRTPVLLDALPDPSREHGAVQPVPLSGASDQQLPQLPL